MTVRETQEERREALLALLEADGWRVVQSVLQRRLAALERQAMAVADIEALVKLQAVHKVLKEILEAPERFFVEENS